MKSKIFISCITLLLSVISLTSAAQTAIPKGTYDMIVNKSPKLQRLTPRILGIKGYEGVLIHRGNNHNHSAGCILVGYKKGVDCIMESTKAEADLLTILMRETKHTIEIK
jgi:uncharacterized ion transporter superfamily protein YfcC